MPLDIRVRILAVPVQAFSNRISTHITSTFLSITANLNHIGMILSLVILLLILILLLLQFQLPQKSRETSSSCYLTHSWRKKEQASCLSGKYFRKRERIRPEFELGPPIPLSALISVALHTYLSLQNLESAQLTLNKLILSYLFLKCLIHLRCRRSYLGSASFSLLSVNNHEILTMIVERFELQCFFLLLDFSLAKAKKPSLPGYLTYSWSLAKN